MKKDTNLRLPLELEHLTDAEYKDLWKSLGLIEIKMVERLGSANTICMTHFIMILPTSSLKSCVMPCDMY